MKRTKHSKLPIVNSVSGGKTSSYMAVHYPAKYNVFALVRLEDENCRFPDEALRKKVEDKIQAPFIGTAEDNTIIHTMFDLEQFIGSEITWVTGLTFDQIIKKKGGYLPNLLQRYCTTNLKIFPIFEWLYKQGLTPCEQRLGFRAHEGRRVLTTMKRLSKKGYNEVKYSFEKHTEGKHKGKNKWEVFDFCKPAFPLFDDGITRKDVINFWKDKPVRFAELNNCQGCFHRDSALLNVLYHKGPEHSKKVIDWFSQQEIGRDGKGTWKNAVTYEKIIENDYSPLFDMELDDFNECDSGYCGL